MEKEQKNLWHHPLSGTFYLVPTDSLVIPGKGELEDLDGKRLNADLDMLDFYKISEDKAAEYLKSTWMEIVAEAGKAFRRMTHFGEIRQDTEQKEELDLEELYQQGISSLSGGSRPSLEGMFKDLKEKLAQKEELAGVAEIFKGENPAENMENLFGIMRNMAVKLDPNAVGEEDSPETWVNILNEQFFGEEEAAYQEEERSRIQKEIEDSIAESLRKHGLTPSADFEEEEG